METRTDGTALYKIHRFPKGRGMQRYLTREKVAYYKAKYPNWRFYQLTEHSTTRQGSVYVSPPKYSDYRRGAGFSSTWGFNPLELRESARKTGNKAISYDDILDVQLALKKGV